MELYPCTCCGYLVFAEPFGSYEICEICFWEDDSFQLRFMNIGAGANSVSLIQAQKNYTHFGACEEDFQEYVRLPLPGEERDPHWRPVDPVMDKIEVPDPQKTYFELVAENFQAGDELYYWRRGLDIL